MFFAIRITKIINFNYTFSLDLQLLSHESVLANSDSSTSDLISPFAGLLTPFAQS